MNENKPLKVSGSTTCIKCNREIYENGKCLFHCEKEHWHPNKNDKSSYHWNKIIDFWNAFEGEVIEDQRKHDYSGMFFPTLPVKKEDFFTSSFLDDNIEYYNIKRPILFNNTIFLGDVYFNNFKFNGVDFKSATFHEGCSFEGSVFSEEKNYEYDESIVLAPDTRLQFNFSDVKCSENIIFNDVEFQCKAVFHRLTFESEDSYASFTNTKFLKLADFWEASFNIVSFEKTDFEGIVVFTKTTFNYYTEFKFTRFEKQLIMNQTIIKNGFDLHEALYDSSNVVFSKVDFKGRAKHRETYQLIKYLLDQKANYIEGNRYYSLELGKHKEDLAKTKWKSLKNFSSWLVFEIHEITSEHGQNWLLPLYWIMILSLYLSGYTYNDEFKCRCIDFKTHILFIFVFLSLVLSWVITIKPMKYLVLFIIGIGFYIELNGGTFDLFFKYMSVFKFEDSNHPGLFALNKILLAYLMYQFVMAVRLDTKR